MVWQTLEHLQSGQMGKVHTLEVTRTEAHDAQKEEPYFLRWEFVCAVPVERICVTVVKQSLVRISWGGQSEYLLFIHTIIGSFSLGCPWTPDPLDLPPKCRSCRYMLSGSVVYLLFLLTWVPLGSPDWPQAHQPLSQFPATEQQVCAISLCICGHMEYEVHVQVRELVGFSSLLPYGFWGPTSSC